MSMFTKPNVDRVVNGHLLQVRTWELPIKAGDISCLLTPPGRRSDIEISALTHTDFLPCNFGRLP